MSFLKLGNVVFNTEYVSRMDIAEDHIIIYLGDPQPAAANNPSRIEFKGDEATALKEWMERHGSVRDPLAPPSQGVY